MKYKIVHDRQRCIGCGACVASCPKFWKMAEDGRSFLKGSKDNTLEVEEKDFKCNKVAAAGCPVNIIHVFKGREKII